MECTVSGLTIRDCDSTEILNQSGKYLKSLLSGDQREISERVIGSLRWDPESKLEDKIPQWRSQGRGRHRHKARLNFWQLGSCILLFGCKVSQSI